MSPPKTQAAQIRGLNQGRERSKRFRARKRGGYVGAGPVNVPKTLVRAMIEMGDIEGAESREIMGPALSNLLERLADRADDLPEFLSDDGEQSINSPLFCQEIGLPSAPRQSLDTVARALDCAGYRLAVKKKKRPD